MANTFGAAVDVGYSKISSLNSIEALFVIFAYTLQIYFDFSGYCDMAVGIGKMMNIDLPINFNSPYKSVTILDFWDRWHITLTKFFTKYLYIPLGGNRKGKIRTYCNTMIVFLVSGFWHGANWTFILWGGLHGLFTVLTKVCKKTVERIPKAVNWLITFLFINVTWVFFRADSIASANALFSRVFLFDFSGFSSGVFGELRLPILQFIFDVAGISNLSFSRLLYVPIMVFITCLALISKNTCEKMSIFKPSVSKAVISAALLAMSIFSFSGVQTFIYMNF